LHRFLDGDPGGPAINGIERLLGQRYRAAKARLFCSACERLRTFAIRAAVGFGVYISA